MTSIYANYATVIDNGSLTRDSEIANAAYSFRSVLLPVVARCGIDLRCADVFEFGAGWGKNLLALRGLGARSIAGVDISPEQLIIAKDLGLESLKLCSPECDLAQDVVEGTFDIVLAIDVLEHLSLEALDRFAKSVPKLLKPGGLLVIQVPNDLAPFNPIRAGDITHVRSFTHESALQVLRLCRLQPVCVDGVPFVGRGVLSHVRKAAARILLRPAVLFIRRFLHGRTTGDTICDPLIMAIGRLENGVV